MMIVLFMLLVWVALQNSSVQGKIVNYITGNLADDLNTEINIQSIEIDFFKTIDLHDIYIEDLAGDTLLYADHLYADISLFSIFKKRFLLNNISLSGSKVNIKEYHQAPNYQFLVDHFSGDGTPSESTPWAFSMKGINIDNSQINYEIDGVTLAGNISKISTKIETFDLTNQIFNIGSIGLENSELDINIVNQDTDIASSSNDSLSTFPASPVELMIQNANIKNSRIAYTNGESKTVKGKFNTNDIDVLIETLTIEDLIYQDVVSGQLKQLKATEKSGLTLDEASANILFSEERISLDGINIQTEHSHIKGNINVVYDEYGSWVQNPNNSLIEAQILPSFISSQDLNYFSEVIDLSDIDIMKTEFINIEGNLAKNYNQYNLTGIKLNIDNFINFEGQGSYGHQSLVSDSPIAFNITKLTTSADKLTDLLPELTVPQEVYNLGEVTLNGKGSGRLGNFQIDTLNLLSDTETYFHGSGRLSGLPNIDSIRYAFDIGKLNTLLSEISKDTTLVTPQIERLGNISYSGKVEGSLNQHHIHGEFTTDIGNLDGNVLLNIPSDEVLSYSGSLGLDQFDLGYFLQDSTYGVTSIKTDFDGRGTNIQDLNIDVQGTVLSTYYNGDLYENIEIDGKIDGLSYDGKISVDNENIAIDYDGKIDLSKDQPSFVFEMQLDTVNLYKFGITDRQIGIAGFLTSDMSGDDVDALSGEVVIKNFSITNNDYTYFAPNDITLKVSNIPGNNKNIILESPMLDFIVSGYILPSEIIKTVQTFANHYFPVRSVDSTFVDLDQYKENYKNQTFDVSLKTKDINPLIMVFSDDISIKDLEIESQFNSYTPSLQAKGSIDSLQYGSYAVKSGTLEINGDADQLTSTLFLDNILSGDEVIIPKAQLSAISSDEVIDFGIDLMDENDNPRFMLGSQISYIEEYLNLNFRDSVIINNERWNIDPDNSIKYKKGDLNVSELKFNKDNQQIHLFSEDTDGKTNLKLDLEEFRITEITNIIGKDEDFFSGQINGTITANDIYGGRFLTTDITVDSLSYLNDPIGKLSIDAKQNKAKNSIEGNFDLVGKNNDALGMLEYNIQNKQMDGFLEVSKMEMRLIDPFLNNIITDSDGFLYGDFQVAGTPTVPDISGNLLFDNASTVIVLSQTRYKIKRQKITFDKTQINLGEITLYDDNDHEAQVSGTITHESFDNLYLDLEANAKGVQFLNTTSVDNNLFYGNIFLDAAVTIVGPPDDLKLDAVATAVNNSNLTLSPFSNIEELISDDFIIFANPDELKKDTTSRTVIKKDKFPVDITMSITINEDANFVFVVDPITGDRLEVSGNANLSIQMKKTGDILLYGTYTATEGDYVFSYGVIEKNFKIEEGGTVTFNGDPLEAKLNIDAVYQTYTNLYDLIKSEVTSDTEIREAQKRSYVNVVLNLAGDLLTPEITLDIQLPSDERTAISDEVDRKLLALRSNPNELNNQVFGLLLFDSFLVTDNSSSGLDSATESLVLGSVSSLITNQLNKIANGLIKGVEVNFNVNNYTTDFADSESLVTELGVGVSKGFLDNRLTLKAGGNFNLESSSATTEFASLAGDFVLEYKLNERGNYVLKVFNKTNSDRLIDENNTKTGISIFIKKDLD